MKTEFENKQLEIMKLYVKSIIDTLDKETLLEFLSNLLQQSKEETEQLFIRYTIAVGRDEHNEN